MKLLISNIDVIEGHLYELMGEDEKIFVFDSFVRVIIDGEVYDHNHIFKGCFVDDDGFNRPNMNAKADAEKLVANIMEAGMIDTRYWTCVGNLYELEKTADERLKEAWSYSDHEN